jgi:single-stranded DNA-specific DHH superfamily exonuclease
MKVTLEQLKNSEPSLVKLSNSVLPINLAYRISKALKVIASELTILEEQRKKLVTKYGAKNEEGNLVVTQENIQKFVEEFSQLLKEEVDIPFEPIDIDNIPADDVKLTPVEISQLEMFIK